MVDAERLSCGIPELDKHLGGGLIPGTLAVVMGSTGIGKTQLGLSFAHQGTVADPCPGIIFDMTSRGDNQNHSDYAASRYNWKLRTFDSKRNYLPQEVWEPNQFAEYLNLFGGVGRRVSRQDLEFDQWKAWKAEIMQKLDICIHFFYSAFIKGARRVVIDGLEPVDRPSESIQLELFEYIYHQILRKEYDWVARDLFRQHFRKQQRQVEANPYDCARIGCLMLYTAHETMLEELIERPLAQGDLLSGANTVVLMGKIRQNNEWKRAIYITKHRGSYCYDQIIPFQVTGQGIVLG